MKPREPHPDYLQFLTRYSPNVQELALATCRFILSEAPEANEFIYEVYTIADHFGFTDRPSEAFVFITTHSNWVNLGFNFGAHLSDPQELLRGEGKLIRHIRIAQMKDLDLPGVRELLRAAISEAERPERQGGKPQIVIRKAQSGRDRTQRA